MAQTKAIKRRRTPSKKDCVLILGNKGEKVKLFTKRSEAKNWLVGCIVNSEGSERERYVDCLVNLETGSSTLLLYGKGSL